MQENLSLRSYATQLQEMLQKATSTTAINNVQHAKRLAAMLHDNSSQVDALSLKCKEKDIEIFKLKNQVNELQKEIRVRSMMLSAAEMALPDRCSDGRLTLYFLRLRKVETKSAAFLERMSDEGYNDDAVVKSVVGALVSERKYRTHLTEAIIENEGMIPTLPCHYESQMYRKLQHKFRPWLCLQELDLCATVSFHAFDRIRNIEFCEEQARKYRRGLL